MWSALTPFSQLFCDTTPGTSSCPYKGKNLASDGVGEHGVTAFSVMFGWNKVVIGQKYSTIIFKFILNLLITMYTDLLRELFLPRYCDSSKAKFVDT